MSVVALASLKGAPGVSTFALPLALTWPSSGAVILAELDGNGGSLASWLQLDQQTGTLSLAAALRRQSGTDVVAEHAHALDGGLAVLPAPISNDSARVASERTASAIAEWGTGDRVVIGDVGRLSNSDVTKMFWINADVSLLIVRPVAAELQRLAASLEQMRAASNFQVILAGTGTYGPKEIAETLQVSVLGVIADDRRAADAIGSGNGDVRQLRKSRLLRSAAELSTTIQELLAHSTSAPLERVSA